MRTRIAAAGTAMLLLLTACSDDSSSTPATTTTAHATTTSVLRSSTTSSTDASTTTTQETLPTPEPPPAAHAPEPYTELGTIEIPKLNITKKLLEGVTLTTLDKGPGHWPGSAMPGHLGNVVIGGHRTSKDRPFRHIDQLVPGDEVILTTLEGRFVYKVRETKIVTPDAMWVIDQHPEYTATLFACHPVGSTKERIIVFLDLER